MKRLHGKNSVKTTTEHHERNATHVLEPNYNVAHAPLNLYSDLAYLLALVPPLLKLKQQSQFTVWWSMNWVWPIATVEDRHVFSLVLLAGIKWWQSRSRPPSQSLGFQVNHKGELTKGNPWLQALLFFTFDPDPTLFWRPIWHSILAMEIKTWKSSLIIHSPNRTSFD